MMNRHARTVAWGLKKFGLLFLILILPVTAGWTGDSLLDLIRMQTEWPAGASWWSGWIGWLGSTCTIPWTHDSHVRMAGALGGAVTFSVAAGILYRFRHGLLTSHARLLPPSRTPGTRTVLIIGLSPRVTGFGEQRQKSEQAADALGLLPIERSTQPKWMIAEQKDQSAEMSALAAGTTPWQQAARIVWDHLSAPNRRRPLDAILVVASTQTIKEFDAFKTFLESRLTDARQRIEIKGTLPAIESMARSGVDYEDYNTLVDALSGAVDHALVKHKAKHDQICVDATAGFKVFSIAAATVTMNRKLIFSYVNNDGVPRYYDAAIELGSALGEG
ncbi:hypothetical protein HL658_13400 [Azospirillum sp. RWY-5-1]|uniref:Uncharacterized protein n=1 Tax=Azospirillum oleiclasticum TaxID=2735135 RepID=A0ABX2TA71_9PROT|nr:hypothetical protein [Azospirillum oleiclasticum]NYZ13549.1 hypothetical protein [Azospirillum oleiclasticum]NYZ20710.1 hypothetical protein [Azospirillum oleiclasticum]